MTAGSVVTRSVMMRTIRFAGLLLVVGLIAASTGWAQGGSITGTVKDSEGKPLPFANVMIKGTDRGAPSNAKGEFTIQGIAPGTYTLLAAYIGYENKEMSVEVQPGQDASVSFSLVQTVVATIQKVEVVGNKEVIKHDTSASFHTVGSEELERLPVDDFEDAVALKSGVVLQGGNLHFRGGRSGEVQYQVDGVPVSDPLGGGDPDIATVAVADSDILLGGFDAEYGNAQSGVINIVTKEGGDHFSGQVSFQTDDFGAPDKTYNNFDRLSLGFGGPTPVQNLTYYISLQGTWTDTNLKTTRRRDVTTILDFIQIADRQNNAHNVQGKLAWKPGPHYKMTFEALDNRRKWDTYNHIWSREGFVESRIDTLDDTGVIRRDFGQYSQRQEDPNWVYYNAAEHTPDFTNDWRQYKVSWSHTLAEGTFYTMKASQNSFNRTTSVRGQLPWEYEADYPEQWADRINQDTNLYYATNGDFPFYSYRNTKTWNFKTDWTSKLGRHRMKTGLEVIYNDIELLSMQFPNRTTISGDYGLNRSSYHYYNPEGSFYLQDRWEHEGMVINAGLRYDVFSVGEQLDPSEVENRVRSQWSPRVGIAYPISDRDSFSFHYGRFSQIPDRSFIFEGRNPAAQIQGNPNLEPETTVAYQAALQHMFSPTVYGQFSVYFKDIFGLLTAEQVQSENSAVLVNQYVNKDYASSRGFEVTISKQFSHHFSGEVGYTYSIATGVASDPNAAANQNFLYLPISEQPLNWDQRHSVSTTFSLAEPGNWRVNTIWTFGTGFPWTPRLRETRQPDPLLTNSERLPSSSNLTVQVDKFFNMWGQRLKLFGRADNLMDSRNIAALETGNFPGPPRTAGTDYRVYYTETGNAGGAYLDDDLNEDGVKDWIPLHDPRVFQEGRRIRMGVQVNF